MDKYVKLMADYCADCVWDRNGASIHIDSLPIPFWLKSTILQWGQEYDASFDEMLHGEFNYKKFSQDGYALAKKLKHYLPDWTIIYFDEYKAFEAQKMQEYRIEIK